MTSKPGKKRVTLPLRSDYTKKFAKDWERLTHSGRYNMQNLKNTIALIVANDGDLPPEYRDHELTGDWAEAEYRECHIRSKDLMHTAWRLVGPGFFVRGVAGRTKGRHRTVVAISSHATCELPGQPCPGRSLASIFARPAGRIR